MFSVKLEFQRGTRFLMPDDLVDRIVKARKEREKVESLQQETALRRSLAVEENSDFLWGEIIAEISRLVDKFNSTYPQASVVFSERSGSPLSGVDVDRQVFPIVQLAVWRNSKHFIEFSITQVKTSFAPSESVTGRIDFTADNNRNISMMTNKGDFLATAKEVADYLLNPVLSV